MGRSTPRESIDRIGEDALFALGEQRQVLGRLERQQRNILALAEARRIEREELVADIEHIRADLRRHEDRLRSFDEIDEQCDGIHLEIMQEIVRAAEELAENEGVVANDAKVAGITFVHPDLLKAGAMVAKRRQLKEHAGVSDSEAEAI